MIRTMPRILIIILSLFLTLIFLFPIVLGILNAGNISGLIFCIFLTTACIFYKQLKKIISVLKNTKMGKIIITVFSVLIISGFSYIIILTLLMLNISFKTSDCSDAVIVLGCKINGNAPSEMLKRRLNAAAEYYHKNPDTIIIVSGGQGKNETVSEADVMKNYLTAHNIPCDAVIIENKSNNTKENIDFSFDIIENRNIGHNITIVTDRFHEYRAHLLAKRHSLEVYSYPADTKWYLAPTYWVREWIAITAEYIL